MSFLSGLRASSSRLTPSLTHLPLLTRAAPIPRRHASSSSSSPRPASQTQVDIDAQADVMRRQRMKQEKLGFVTDFMARELPVTPLPTEPKTELSWFLPWVGSGGRLQYLAVRVSNWTQTYQMLSKGASTGLYEANARLSAPLVRQISKPLRERALEIYTAYHEAQAAGDAHTISQISRDTAFRAAQPVLQSRRKMKWELMPRSVWERVVDRDILTWSGLPRFMWARGETFDKEGTKGFGQMCLRFDTKQKLTIYDARDPKVVASERIQRVTDYVVFEKRMPSREGWQMKVKIEPTRPDFLKTEEEKVRDKAQQAETLRQQDLQRRSLGR